MPGISFIYQILTAADVWAYSVRKLSMQTLLSIGSAAVAMGVGVKGAYVQIVAATAADIDGIMVRVSIPVVASTVETLTDIAVGAAGAEVVVAGNIKSMFIRDGAGQPFEQSAQIYLPNVKIAGGSRVSARVLGVAGNATIEVAGSV